MKSVFMQLATAFQRVLPRRFVRQADQYYFDDEVIIVSSDNVAKIAQRAKNVQLRFKPLLVMLLG